MTRNLRGGIASRQVLRHDGRLRIGRIRIIGPPGCFSDILGRDQIDQRNEFRSKEQGLRRHQASSDLVNDHGRLAMMQQLHRNRTAASHADVRLFHQLGRFADERLNRQFLLTDHLVSQFFLPLVETGHHDATVVCLLGRLAGDVEQDRQHVFDFLVPGTRQQRLKAFSRR